jgi:hypothetical protein
LTLKPLIFRRFLVNLMIPSGRKALDAAPNQRLSVSLCLAANGFGDVPTAWLVRL